MDTEPVYYYSTGVTKSHIDQHSFDFLCEIPVEAAVAWVQAMCPQAVTGKVRAGKLVAPSRHDHTTTLLTPDLDARLDGWSDKLFVVVRGAEQGGRALAINKSNRTFALYMEKL